MKRILTGLAALAAFSCAPTGSGDNMQTMEENFRQTPQDQPIAVYWYWMDGNISEEGVVKDLQAMKKAGINRVQIGMIGDGQGAAPGPVRLFTDEWWKILHTMFRTAGELNIEVGLFNCPGWSQSGGPWVQPGQSMRYLTAVNDTIEGPMKFNAKLPELGKDGQDVKVIAYPLIEGTAKFTTAQKVAAEKEITLKSDKDAIVRSLTLRPIKAGAATAELAVREGDGWRTVDTYNLDRSNAANNVGFDPLAPFTFSLPETNGKEFRLTLSAEGFIGAVELSDKPTVERYAEKSFRKMWQTPLPMWDAYMWRDQPLYPEAKTLQADQVQDISEHLTADGTLTWEVPAGKWVISRTGMQPTGVTCSPAPKEGTGLETDKMSKEHIRAHFDNYIGQILERIPAEDRKTFRIVVEDSYETGGQNWTDHFIRDFKEVYGYDPVPFMPVYNGETVGSTDISDRFLWDARRLIADQIAYNYVGGLREVSNEHGLTTWLENYGHWGFPGEFLQYGGQSDEIGGEFWSFGDLGNIENRAASSCGHIYGKQKVWAESFTCGGPDFTQHPGQMKQRGDRFFTEGINASLMHLYIQQPDDRQPGINAWFGNEFNRNNTWFSQMDIFSGYLKRCNYMLQQGRYVADVAYFLGEDAPKMTGVRNPEIPLGYSYDYINAEILHRATAKDGKLVLPSGMEYRVLVLPKIETMRPELLAKLQQLVKEGIVIEGPAPRRSPSLQDYPNADTKVQAMAEEMWQPAANAEVVEYGKGRIYKDASLEKIFADLGVQPDFAASDAKLPVLFIHLTQPGGEMYFVSNQSDKPIAFDANFRIDGKQPELWNPLTSEVRLLPQFTQQGGLTQLPMELDAFESSFIIFRSAAKQIAEAVNYPKPTIETALQGPWTINFQEGRGVPAELKTDKLFDWITSEDIHIKYFSGTATYKTGFELKDVPAEPTYIDLGRVSVMARVRINGKEVGGVWSAPYRLNITSALQKGQNEVEIEVVNNWRNRLIGEKREIPENERFTFTSATYLNADSELQSSGLLGPVRVLSYPYITIE